MFARRAIKHRASQIGVIVHQILHQIERQFAQMLQPGWLAVGKKQFIINAHFFFYLRVIREELPGCSIIAQNLYGCLALGIAVTGAIFGYHAGSSSSDFRPDAVRLGKVFSCHGANDTCSSGILG